MRLQSIQNLFKYRKSVRSLLSYFFAMQKEGDNANWGSISDDDVEGLKQAFQLAEGEDGPIVEVGCLYGLTTNVLASLKRPEQELITVENFTWNPFHMPPMVHRRFTRRVLSLAMAQANTTIFDGDSGTFFSNYDGPAPALVFIDADHSYESAKIDITGAKKTGAAVICGHDFRDDFPGVQRAVKEEFGEGQFEIVSTIWFARNPDEKTA